MGNIIKITNSDIHNVVRESVKRLLEEKDNSFTEWFSQNGLKDENGNPLLVYHGSGRYFKSFDIRNTYDGKLCFTADKNWALTYTHWDNGDDNWRTINGAYEYFMYEGYTLNKNLPFPEYLNLLTMIDRDGEQIDRTHAYNVIRSFYNEQYSNPTLYHCFLRNAEVNDLYKDEFNVYDDDDVWIVKTEKINYTPLPNDLDMNLNTYIE